MYIKEVLFDKKTMTELSFADIQDKIELEEEKLKTNVFKKLNNQLKSEIKHKEKIEKDLISSVKINKKQAARLNAIFENESHIILSLDKKLRLTSFNKNFVHLFEKMLGVVPEINDMPFIDYKLMPQEIKEKWIPEINKVFLGEPRNFIASTFNLSEQQYTSIYINPIYEKNKINQVSIIGHDITDKVIAEERLNVSLKEKDILLKEVHHRVKNNLQVISSIFNLQSAYSKEPGIREVLKESQTRIKSMAYIHESLYKSTNFGKINFEEYLRKLTKNLIQSYTLKENKVTLLTETEKVILHLDQAVPCGLIVNEIISNSLKHAFPPNTNGIVIVHLSKKGNKIHLKLVDNGIGIPEKIVQGDDDTLGIQLIKTLTEQLRGDIKFITDGGTSVELTFDFQEA